MSQAGRVLYTIRTAVSRDRSGYVINTGEPRWSAAHTVTLGLGCMSLYASPIILDARQLERKREISLALRVGAHERGR